MQSTSGKTFRFITIGNTEDSSLRVNAPIELFGYELQPNVSYSMKKKGRWQLPELLTSQYDNQDTAVIYSKHQCVYHERPLLNLYLYDSTTDTNMGSLDVSNQTLAKGSFNVNSVIHQIKNRNDYTKKEKKLFNKECRKKLNNDKISKRDEALLYHPSPSNEHLCEQELRRKCVYLQEYVRIRDLSKVNMVTSRRFRSCYRRDVRKRASDECDIDCEISEEEIEEEEIIEEETKQPFVLTESDFYCQNKGYCRRRKQKKKKVRNEIKITMEDKYEDVEKRVKYREERIVKEEMLNVVIYLSKDVFMEEMSRIVDFCKCWKSESKPWTLLIDLNHFEVSNIKSFILLTPSVEISEDIISVNVLFNIDNKGLKVEDILERRFKSVVDIVSILQSKLVSESEQRVSSSTNLLILDGLIEGLNLHKVKKVDCLNSLYLYHNEWKSCELRGDNFEESMSLNVELNYSVVECNVCGSVTPDDKLIVIKECNHHVCENCVSTCVLQQINEDSKDITCPCQGCLKSLNVPTILSLVPWRLYKCRLNILQSTIMTMAGKPCFGCGAVLIDEEYLKKTRKAVEYVCECGRSICSSCGQLQHWPSSCQEMKEHSLNVVQFKEKEKLSKPSFSNIRLTPYCTNCNTWISNFQLRQISMCICLKPFCNNCRGLYESHISSCEMALKNKLTFPYYTADIPIQRPKFSRLKLYNQSIYISLLRRPDSTNELKEDLCRIMSTTLLSRAESQTTKDLMDSYSQVLRLLESMYVAAYNSHRKNNPRKYHLLQVSTDHLLFYVRIIQRLKDEIHQLMKEKRRNTVEAAILDKFTCLESNINTSKVYINKILILLRPEDVI